MLGNRVRWNNANTRIKRSDMLTVHRPSSPRFELFLTGPIYECKTRQEYSLNPARRWMHPSNSQTVCSSVYSGCHQVPSHGGLSGICLITSRYWTGCSRHSTDKPHPLKHLCQTYVGHGDLHPSRYISRTWIPSRVGFTRYDWKDETN